MGLKGKGWAATVIVRGTVAEKGAGGTGAAPTICSSHHHHRPDGNLIAAVGVTGLCVIEMKRRATPLERNYYYHLCVYEYVVCTCSCHNHQKPQSQSHRSRSGAEQKPGQPGPSAIRHCHCFPTVRGVARLGLVLFFFFFASCFLFLSLCCMQLCVLCCAGCTHFHMNAPQTWHTPQRGGKCSLPGGRGRGEREMTKTAKRR